MVHYKISICLAHELIAHRLRVTMMIARGESVLSLMIDAPHLSLHAILYRIDSPPRVGIENVGYDRPAVFWQLPIGGIRLAIEIG